MARSQGTHTLQSGFPTRRWTVVSSSSLLSRPWWNLVQSRRRGGGKVKSVLCFSSAESFPRPSCCRVLQRLMSIRFATRQHGPGHASEFISDSDDDLVARCTLRKPVHPLPESSGVVLDAKQHRTSTVDEHTSQIDVSAFADTEQLLFASGRVLPWHDTDPSCEVASSAKGCSITDGRHSCARDQRAEAGDLE